DGLLQRYRNFTRLFCISVSAKIVTNYLYAARPCLITLDNGRNLTLIKSTKFAKLTRFGLPNKLRGEIWELCSGAMYLRYTNNGLYEKLHEDNVGKVSLSTEEI